MKAFSYLLVTGLLLGSGRIAFSQNHWYASSGGELIFSFANLDYAPSPEGQVMRFTPFVNLQSFANYDFSPKSGFLTGLAVRNVGYIYKFKDTGLKKKYRNYVLGIPVGLKFGDMNGLHFYGGYEIEFPFNYKEKTFEDEKKIEKFSVWFSDRDPALYNTLFVGIQFPYGINLKFKYYLTPFHNQDYTESDGSKPYAGFNDHVFYFSLSFIIFRNTDFYYFHESGGNRRDTNIQFTNL